MISTLSGNHNEVVGATIEKKWRSMNEKESLREEWETGRMDVERGTGRWKEPGIALETSRYGFVRDGLNKKWISDSAPES